MFSGTVNESYESTPGSVRKRCPRITNQHHATAPCILGRHISSATGGYSIQTWKLHRLCSWVWASFIHSQSNVTA